MCVALTFLLDNIYIRFGIKLSRKKTVGIPMGTISALLCLNGFCFVMKRLHDVFFWRKAIVIEAFSLMTR